MIKPIVFGEEEEKRFWSKVDIKHPDECWIWKGAMSGGGYPSFKFNGKVTSAQRAAYALTYGSIDDKLYTLHSCDNPKCVNPYHLRLGTPGDNMQDMVKRNRCNSYEAKVTHCPQGHEYTTENTYTHNGYRKCKICVRKRSLKYWHRNKPMEASHD
jgi:hypothetical protein